MSESVTVDGGAREALRSAREALDDARAAIDRHGEETVVAVADADRELRALFDRYEDSATGTGDFAAYVEFQEKVVELVEGLDDDLPERETFEAVVDRLDKRRLSETDFEAARDRLDPTAAFVDRLDARDEAEERFRRARHEARDRLRTLDDRLGYLDRLQRLGDADLDAPVERLRDPIETYNEGVEDAFSTFVNESSARRVFAFVEATDAYPLVEFRQPARELAEYVAASRAGDHPIPTLLEYADYSPSKLDHYVDDPGALKTRVAVHRTYLDRLDPDPLTISWPPPSAGQLRYRAEELVAVVGRFAPESVVESLRAVRSLSSRSDYERLRTAAQAAEELDADEQARLASGGVAEERRAVEAERERLATALEETAES